MKQNKENVWLKVILGVFLLFILIFIIYQIVKTINKEKEKENLQVKFNQLFTQKYYLEQLSINLEKYYRGIYNFIKFIFISGFILLSIFIYNHLKEPGLLNFISAFTDVFGALGLSVLFLCLVFEENPMCIFSMRNRLKKTLKQLVYSKYQPNLDKLPEIISELEKVTKELKRP